MSDDESLKKKSAENIVFVYSCKRTLITNMCTSCCYLFCFIINKWKMKIIVFLFYSTESHQQYDQVPFKLTCIYTLTMHYFICTLLYKNIILKKTLRYLKCNYILYSYEARENSVYIVFNIFFR